MGRTHENMSYRDIKQVVLDRIQTGVWSPDSILPSETDLATEFSSTRTTVNRALRELAEEGYLERKRKAGTRVLKSPIRKAQFSIPLVRDEIAATGAAYRYSLVDKQVHAAPSWLAARLDLKRGQDVLHLRCMHYADNAPFQFEVRWIVTDVVPEVLDESFEQSGPNDWLVKKVPFTNLELSFLATKANGEIAEFLDAPLGDPIFTAERITWLRGAPVTYAKLFFAPGYRMTTHL
ncbi:GntR family transcriptional regulator [Ruegeria atlantica]|uniref:GntR family transcriptional regulator n=1 Tax=Ruegeria atlantica TaxID=81569 RepID=UPI00147F1A4A|nr:GntR family transcriptional regulator [Ruegeria atlantica]